MRKIGMLVFKEPVIESSRKILHVDMDAFFAAIEQRDHPEYRGQPVIIARHPKETGGKGVVATASYEARKFGVHSAMSAQEAYQRCPEGIFVKGRHSYYRKVGHQVREIFLRYTDLIEPLSIDEAFLDVTHNKFNIHYAMDVAVQIQRTIYQELQLTCSIGVSYNKFIAKLASDYQKPQGITIITPKKAIPFLSDLPIEKFYGIGKRSVEKLHERGIYNGRDLRALSQEECLSYFGKGGIAIYERVRGVDNRPIRTHRNRKSVGKENTFYPFLYSEEAISDALRKLSRSVSETLIAHNIYGKTVTLKLRNTDFQTKTRQNSLTEPIHDYMDIYFQAQALWDEYGDITKGIRLLGVTVSDLSDFSYTPIKLEIDKWKR